MKKRVQCPKVHERKDRKGSYWFFRYRLDELQPDGSIKTTRKFHTIGPSKGPEALSKKEAQLKRDEFLVGLNAAPTKPEATVVLAKEEAKPPEFGAILFGKLAELWQRDYVERAIGDRPLVAKPTREKYLYHLKSRILPRWAKTRLADLKARDVMEWLQDEAESWHMMSDLRGVMSGIITKAQEWEILPETYANPMRRVKLPKKWEKREKRILTESQTDAVLGLLNDPNLLVCETCVDTGTRISEVLGLKVKHVDLEKGCIHIVQRNWRGDIDKTKTDRSRRVLALGRLAERYKAWVAKLKDKGPEAWIFPQDVDPTKPLWDSGVRKALKLAAEAENCDFPGFGPHSLRRANITWRQEVGGSAIEASRIAGHNHTKITEAYTVVQLGRQDELTRKIQEKRAKAEKRGEKKRGRPRKMKVVSKGAAA